MRPFTTALAGLIIILYSMAAIAQQTDSSVNRLARIDSLIHKHIQAQHIPGATVLLIKKGKIIYNKAFGYADIEAKTAMSTTTIFRIASQTKAITSLAVMMLWEQGKFLLDDPIAMYIPAFANPRVLTSYNIHDNSYTTKAATKEITVRDLLRHTSGIAYAALFSDPTMFHIYKNAGIPSGIGTTQSTIKEKMELLASLPLQHHPSEQFTYGLNTDLLGYLIEIWSGKPLNIFLQDNILTPLAMHDTYFTIPKDKQQRLASLYEINQANKLVKVNHPLFEGADPDYPKLKSTYFSGGAGLSSTTADMANFYALFLNKGEFKGKRLIAQATVELMLRNQLGDQVKIAPNPPLQENLQFTLAGFSVVTPKNTYLSPQNIGSFGWGGAFNTHAWADPKAEIIALLFTQEYLSPWFRIDEEFKTAVYQALDDL